MNELFSALVGALITAVPLLLKLRQVSKAQPVAIIQRLDAQDQRFDALEARLLQNETLLFKIRDVLQEIEVFIQGQQDVEAVKSQLSRID